MLKQNELELCFVYFVTLKTVYKSVLVINIMHF